MALQLPLEASGHYGQAGVLTLGGWPTLSIEAARKLAVVQAGKVAGGGDPATERKRERLRERATVGPALEDYEAELARRGIVNRSKVMTSLRRGFRPAIKAELDSLDLRTVVGLIDRIGTAVKVRADGTRYTTPGAAQEFRKLARGFLGWAALKGLVHSNVLAGVRMPKPSREERQLATLRAGRALNDAEIVAVWHTCEGLNAFGALVRMALLTGLRRGELAELCWPDVSEDAIVIPAGRTKMGAEHRVPVTPSNA